MGKLIKALIFVALLLVSLQPLVAKRVALVIGNAVYDPAKPMREQPNLHNTREDADLVSTTFENLGFEVILLKDAKKATIQQGLAQLRVKGKGANIGLVYFSGHGMEVNGANYVCPIGARLSSRTDPEVYHVSLNSILHAMETSGIQAKMVVLDCCRNDPFQKLQKSIEVENSSNKSGGLAVLDRIPHSTLVMYAAGPGQFATSGSGKNSPFTEIFCSVIKDPKISCFEAFFQVSDHVKQKTGARQQPWVKFDGAADAFRKYTFHGTAPASTDSNTGVVSSGNQDAAMSEEIARIERERQDALASGSTAVAPAADRLKKENDALSVFLRGWVANQESNSPFAWVSDFSANPKYTYWKKSGGAPVEFLLKDRRELIERYPVRSYTVIGNATGDFFDDYQRAVIVISYHYQYNGVKRASGNSFNTLGLKKAGSQWKITSYDETVRKNARLPSGQPPVTYFNQASVDSFTRQWLINNASNNANDWVSDFATSVRYGYKKNGNASHAYLRKDRQELIAKFPKRSYKILSFKVIDQSANTATANLVYSYDYGRVKGKSALTLGLSVLSGQMKITSFDEKISK
jgi:hypothetical protein